MKRFLYSLIIGGVALASQALATPSILDVKHTIADENVVPPESFETKTIELESNFYLRNFSVDGGENSARLGNAEEYQTRLSQLPTEIEMPYNDIVGRFIDMYLGKRSKLVSDMLALHNYYGNTFVEELEKEGLPLELQYLPVIESAINPNAVSRAGATGLWQFMPGTAKGLGMEINSLVDQRRDPRESSRYAAKYLKQLYSIYDDWSLAIAAYNCGPGNVNKAMKRAGAQPGEKKDFWEIYFFLPNETRGYLPAFIAANYVMNYYDKHGIKPRVIKKPLVTDTVSVCNRVHFNQISGVLNIPVDEIRMLNPQYRKDIIPGNNHPYTLTLPSAQILSYVMSEQEILDFEKDLYAQRTSVEPGSTTLNDEGIQPDGEQSQNAEGNTEVAKVELSAHTKVVHVVARGENLRDIAKKYNVSATDIKHWNNLRRAKVAEGDELVIELYERTAPDASSLAMNVPAPKKQEASTSTSVPEPPKKAETVQPSVPARAKQADSGKTSTEVPAPAKSSRNVENREMASADNTSRKSNSSSKTAASASETKSQKQQRQEAAGKSKGSSSSKASGKSSKSKQPKTTSVTVKGGDSLEKLARQNNTTVQAIRDANNIKGDKIIQGQKLVIPSQATGGKSSKSKGGSKSTSSKSKKKSKKRN